MFGLGKMVSTAFRKGIELPRMLANETSDKSPKLLKGIM
jgi:hypothetical protein